MAGLPIEAENGTIAEIEPGVFYIYSSATKSWSRAEGGVIPTPATALRAGLMTSEDYAKLERLVVPPPQSTLTTDQCSSVFSSGTIALTSADSFVDITGNAKLVYPDGDVTEEIEISSSHHLRGHTFDFSIDTDALLEYMKDNDKFRVITKVGDQGPPGTLGDPGESDLVYGPDGAKGEPGTNASTELSLLPEAASLEQKKDSNRAVVSITTEEVSATENYLVVTRANIGNPNACPSRVTLVSDVPNSWVFAIPYNINEDVSVAIANGKICASEVYYLDLELINDAIKAEFERQIVLIKESMERVVSFWLTIMSSVFDEQKAALCCALQYCRSQYRNTTTRQYIESQKVQASHSNSSIIIEGNPSDPDPKTTLLRIPMHPACLPDGFGFNNINALANNADPIAGPHCYPALTIIGDSPVNYQNCPPGFTPRDTYRALIKEKLAETTDNPLDPSDPQIVIKALPAALGIIQDAGGQVDEDMPISMALSASRAPATMAWLADERPLLPAGIVELQYESPNVDALRISMVSNEGDKHSAAVAEFTITDIVTVGGTMRKFSDNLTQGTYTLCVSNVSKNAMPLNLVVATQNAQFVDGTGDQWDDEAIVAGFTNDDGIELSTGTTVALPDALLPDSMIWVRLKVSAPVMYRPYLGECGGGPSFLPLDKRICREPPANVNPLKREAGSGSTELATWITSKCGDYLVPDAIEIQLGGLLTNLGGVVACRALGGHYTCGFEHENRTYQIMLEQVNGKDVRPEPSAVWPSKVEHKLPKSAKAPPGSEQFRCTVLYWNDPICGGAPADYSTKLATADCEHWSLQGNWELGNDIVPFKAVGISNDSSHLGTSGFRSLILTVDNDGAGQYRTIRGKLVKGKYIADIIDCCIENNNQFTGHVQIRYQTPSGPEVAKMAGYGPLAELASAIRMYRGQSLMFTHDGGPVSVSLAEPVAGQIGGAIKVRITEQGARPATPMVGVGGAERNCQMRVENIEWYYRGWADGKCNGFVIDIYGQSYIIAHRDDVAFTHQCSQIFGDVAIAWPTTDGVRFLGVPNTGSVMFKQDKELEDIVHNSIKTGNYEKESGDINAIKMVVFPTILQ